MDGRTDRQMDWQTFAFIELRIYEAYFIDKSNPFFHSVIESKLLILKIAITNIKGFENQNPSENGFSRE